MKVLVAINIISATSSEPAVNAILERGWARGTIFYLFSVLETDVNSVANVSEASKRRLLLEERVRMLYDTMLRLKTVRPEATYLCQVASGELVQNIVSMARELSADLIIIGASQANSSSRESLGAQVSRLANCPVESLSGISSVKASFPNPSST